MSILPVLDQLKKDTGFTFEMTSRSDVPVISISANLHIQIKDMHNIPHEVAEALSNTQYVKQIASIYETELESQKLTITDLQSKLRELEKYKDFYILYKDLKHGN